MIYFDILEPQNIVLLAVIIVIAAILFFVLFSFAYLNIAGKRFKHKIKDKSNTVRMYIVDVKNDKVEYFNSSKLRNKKTISINSFYSHFAASNREDIISWIGDLLDNDPEVRNYIEVGAYVKRFKKDVLSILQVQKIDYENKKLFIESYLINPEKSKYKRGSHKTVSKERLIRLIRANKNVGFTFCVNFFNKFTKSDEISNLAYVELKNIMTALVSKDVFASELDNTKFVLTNTGISDKIQAVEFIEILKTKIYSYLTIESFADEIDISIGVAENKLFVKNESNLFDSVINLSEFAKDDEKLVIFYDQNLQNDKDEKDLKSELDDAIEKGKMRYLYQPVYNLKYNRCVAYIASISPIYSSFDSIEDLKNYAFRVNEGKKLLSTIAKNSIMNFSDEKYSPNIYLFFPINVSELQYVSSAFRYISGLKDTKVILSLKEKDISSIPDEDNKIENFIDIIKTLKSKGFSVSLEIDDTILNLSPVIYKLFDYYEIRINEFTENKKGINIPVFKGLVESLLAYQKPIIAQNIPNWDVVNLVYKFGFTNISGDPIGEKNENIIPVDKKVIQKIKKLTA